MACFAVFFPLQAVAITPLPLPTEKHARWDYAPVQAPVVAATADQCKPLGVGNPGAGGFDLQVGLPPFAGPIDIYLGFRSEATGSTLYLITAGNALYQVTGTLDPSMAWMSGVEGSVNESVFGEIPTVLLTPGTYTFYLTVTPAGNLNAAYPWSASYAIAASDLSFNLPDEWDEISSEPSPSPIVGPLPLPMVKGARWEYDPVQAPVIASYPSQCKPIGVGDPESGLLTMQVGLPPFAGPVDIYVGFRSEATGSTLYLITAGNALYRVTGTLDPSMAWKASIEWSLTQPLFGEIPVAVLTPGTYRFYLTVTPADNLDASYPWTTSIDIPVHRPLGWDGETHGNQADPGYPVVFPHDVVNRIDMFITPEDWEAMHAFEIADGDTKPEPAYRPCTLVFHDKTWWDVGVRFKGNSTLNRMRGKVPFHLDFDKFEDDYPEIRNQRFYGFDDIALGNNFFDNSMIRERVAYDIFREAGVPASMSASYRVYVDFGEGLTYFGLYTMTEIPEEHYLERNFGNASGNLYKPQGRGATWAVFDRESFVKKTNQEEADWSDIEAAIAALHAPRDNPAAWRAGLEAVFDVEGFLRWLAINSMIQNWDTYGRMMQNYYLYTDPSDGKIHWIPWDLNMAFMKATAPHISLDSVDERWPLIRFLIDDPVYHAMYVQFVHDTAEGVYQVDRAQARFQYAHALVEPYVVGPEGEWPGYTFLRNDQEFYNTLTALLWHPLLRRNEVVQYLSEEGFVARQVVITEIHYNPSPDQGDEFEFIEMCNMGDSPIALGGFSFTDGVEFTFPSGAVIAPGECIVVAEDATLYQGHGYQVFEWTSGQLSDNGETIRLKDSVGVEIDRVSYDDEYPWPTPPDGTGPSLSVNDPFQDNYMPQNWSASSADGGTPGAMN